MGCKELPGDLQLRNAAVPLSSSASILINLVRVVNIPYCNNIIVIDIEIGNWFPQWSPTPFDQPGLLPSLSLLVVYAILPCMYKHAYISRANRCADIKCEEILQMMRTRSLWYSKSRVRLQCLMDKTQPADWRKLLEVSSSPVYSQSSFESQK